MDQDDADEILMLRYRDGDSLAFEPLYARHKAPLYRYLLRQCGVAAIAEELFQDVWLNLIRARADYTVKAKFATYLYRLAHNRLIDYYRRQSRGVPMSFDDPEGPALEAMPDAGERQPEQHVERSRQAERLLQLIAELPEAQRETFLLHMETELSLDEIAETTGVNRETAKSRLRYAVAKLKRDLNSDKVLVEP